MNTYTSELTASVQAVQWMGEQSLPAVREAEVPFQPMESPHAIRVYSSNDVSTVVHAGDWLAKDGDRWFVVTDLAFKRLGYVSA